MTDKYAVIGNPIAHSKSPLIHAAFARQTGQNICYERVLAPLDGFANTVQDLIAQGFKGVNVTVPFKFAAYALCNNLSARAKSAGAVNTLSFSNDTMSGDNTDGAGLVRDITQNCGTAFANKRVLLLGAGGAAEGVLLPLIHEMPSSIVVANRSVDKAQKMIEKSAKNGVPLQASTYAQLQNQTFDIIINATSTGLTDTALPLPDSVFGKNCLAYDMMYGRETPFMAQARANGATVADGLGMLVEQAAEAFYIWRGVRPETAPVMQALRDGSLI
jgi:shikimate dehydrogenase